MQSSVVAESSWMHCDLSFYFLLGDTSYVSSTGSPLKCDHFEPIFLVVSVKSSCHQEWPVSRLKSQFREFWVLRIYHLLVFALKYFYSSPNCHSQPKSVHSLTTYFLPPQLTFTNPSQISLLLSIIVHVTYPSDWRLLCPKARWQHLQVPPELSWRSRRWGNEYCWGARPPSAPSRSCMLWGASTRRERHTKGQMMAGDWFDYYHGVSSCQKDTSIHLRYLCP